jgi:hypothetical protein
MGHYEGVRHVTGIHVVLLTSTLISTSDIVLDEFVGITPAFNPN